MGKYVVSASVVAFAVDLQRVSCQIDSAFGAPTIKSLKVDESLDSATAYGSMSVEATVSATEYSRLVLKCHKNYLATSQVDAKMTAIQVGALH